MRIRPNQPRLNGHARSNRKILYKPGGKWRPKNTSNSTESQVQLGQKISDLKRALNIAPENLFHLNFSSPEVNALSSLHLFRLIQAFPPFDGGLLKITPLALAQFKLPLSKEEFRAYALARAGFYFLGLVYEKLTKEFSSNTHGVRQEILENNPVEKAKHQAWLAKIVEAKNALAEKQGSARDIAKALEPEMAEHASKIEVFTRLKQEDGVAFLTQTVCSHDDLVFDLWKNVAGLFELPRLQAESARIAQDLAEAIINLEQVEDDLPQDRARNSSQAHELQKAKEKVEHLQTQKDFVQLQMESIKPSGLEKLVVLHEHLQENQLLDLKIAQHLSAENHPGDFEDEVFGYLETIELASRGSENGRGLREAENALHGYLENVPHLASATREKFRAIETAVKMMDTIAADMPCAYLQADAATRWEMIGAIAEFKRQFEIFSPSYKEKLEKAEAEKQRLVEVIEQAEAVAAEKLGDLRQTEAALQGFLDSLKDETFAEHYRPFILQTLTNLQRETGGFFEVALAEHARLVDASKKVAVEKANQAAIHQADAANALRDAQERAESQQKQLAQRRQLEDLGRRYCDGLSP